MKDDLKAKFFQELQQFECFQAQTALEDETIDSLQTKMLNIDPKGNLTFEYATIRGAIDALKLLKAHRVRYLERARSRTT